MNNVIAYLDTSTVHAGRIGELRPAMAELAAFVEANEPRIILYSVYFTPDESTMSVLHVHPDIASLELHLKVAGPKFPPIAPFITMETIEIFGHPTPDVTAQLVAKAKLLGHGTVIVRELHAGFARTLQNLAGT
ncbi:hypothetical protein FHJ30_05890 [Arthrobacter sp. BB-1]|nr:hypothetical protein FHJ30_05890 [Arthrobacter sp. BB-1]UEL29485.1 hypothetical protein KTR40_05010 [Pseudarthrobacter sp. L1SW]VII95099.1 hypothetical protein [Arthrobacter sp. DR-2P]